MSSEKSQKHIYAQEHQLYHYYNNLNQHSGKETNTVQYKRYLERSRRRVSVYFIVQKLSLSHKLKTLAEHRKICQKNLCF